jgi:flagellar biosynthesis GTPase FlhF
MFSPHLPSAGNLPIKHHGDRTFGRKNHRADSFASSTTSQFQAAAIAMSPPPETPPAEATDQPQLKVNADAATTDQKQTAATRSARAHPEPRSPPTQLPAARQPAVKRFTPKQLEKASQESNKKRKRQNTTRAEASTKHQESRELEQAAAHESAGEDDQQQERTETPSTEQEQRATAESALNFGEKVQGQEDSGAMGPAAARPLKPVSYQFLSSPFNSYQTSVWDKEDKESSLWEKEDRRGYQQQSSGWDNEDKKGREERQISSAGTGSR